MGVMVSVVSTGSATIRIGADATGPIVAFVPNGTTLTLLLKWHGQVVTGPLYIDPNGNTAAVIELVAPFLPPTGDGLEGLANLGA